MLMNNETILRKVEQMEKKVIDQDEKIRLIFEYLKQFIKGQDTPRKQIGFRTKKK